MPIFLDFDGTIVDVWKRYHAIFCNFYEIDLDLELYKERKKAFQNDYYLAEMFADTTRFDDYKKYKRDNLENVDYLKLDSLLLKNKYISSYNILTYRNNPNNLFLQLDYLELKVNISNVIILNPENTTKKDYLSSFLSAVIVGDSESEYDCAENRKINVFLVKTGLRNVENYKLKDNIHIIENINQLSLYV
jgi:phosphoglycolate phosphatase-like HAD superfamily hydrolase